MAKWNIDPDHSVAAFSIRHMMVANVRGQFNKISGTVIFDIENKSNLAIEADIDAAGIYTGIGKRDEHLSSPDFFDVENNPKISFRSTGFEPEGNNRGKLTGELTIHGITQQINLAIQSYGPVISPADFGGETTLGLSAKSIINREDFGMMWNVPLDDGGLMVGKEVEIYLDIEADLVE